MCCTQNVEITKKGACEKEPCNYRGAPGETWAGLDSLPEAGFLATREETERETERVESLGDNGEGSGTNTSDVSAVSMNRRVLPCDRPASSTHCCGFEPSRPHAMRHATQRETPSAVGTR